jgi:alkaline phosphatase
MSRLTRIFFIGVAATVLSCSFYHQPFSKPGRPAAERNIILLISDGAGFNTFESGNYFQFGEKMPELYRDFSVRIASKTDMLNFVDKTINGPLKLGSSDSVCPGCTLSQDCSCDYDKWYAKPQGYDPMKMWTSFNYVKEGDNYLAFTDSAAAATAINIGKKPPGGAWE